MPARPKPEIMSPAGYWPQLHAAVDAGADSVYFGLHHFSARAKVGFSLVELPEVMRTLHRRGVKGFVTFNTLIFEHEMESAAKTLAAIAEAGADAIIVQDLGVLKLARQITPSLEIHGSTQMSITSADGVRLAQDLGVSRVTLARELSLAEIRAIRDAVECELEIFVHGALCVAYSGQCFSSEAWGGRSANRGQCAQACRLPYELLVDGKMRPLADARYLLSPGDLYALRQVPQIMEIGISALKIEGRYKDAEYVSLTTRAYREAVDGAAVDRETELRLEQVYSRGLGPYFLTGTNHQTVVRGRAPRHRGLLIGRVMKVSDRAIEIQGGETPVKPGDGVVFDAADWRSPQEPEEGGRVFEVASRDGKVELRFANGAIDPARVRRGDLVWRTHDPDLDKAVRAMPPHRQPVNVRVVAREGQPLVTEWTVGHVIVTVQSESPLETARNRVLDEEFLRAQLGRLGNTPYELADIQLEVEGSPFAPPSLLNDLRRKAVERLEQAQETPHPRGARTPACSADTRVAAKLPPPPQTPTLHLLIRTPEQLDAVLSLRPASITLDYLDLYGLRPALDRIRAAGLTPRVAAPRILKPGEERIADFLVSCGCPILVRSTGLLHSLRNRAHTGLIGDFSLNAANSVSADELLSLGLTLLTPTHDLNAQQVADLARQIGGTAIEAVAYQHLPVFHTEHCVFCRFLSTGTSYLDCGRPCEHHRVALRDEAGRAHPVLADVGCRNTVFGAQAQEASRHMETWLAAGIRGFRLEFAHESAEQVVRATRAFENALARRISWHELARELQQATPQGITEGSLYVPEGYNLLPILQ